MKPHLVIKFAQHVARPQGPIPDWQQFIHDKSLIVDRLEPQFDTAMRENGLDFWVTREFSPRRRSWSEDEVAAGLDRIFRVILRRETGLPPELVARIQLNPSFEYVRPIVVSGAPEPEPVRAASLSDLRFDTSRTRIGLPRAHMFGRGDRGIRVAILDTGIDAQHPELAHAIESQADFVNMEGLDTTQFIGDLTGYDKLAEDEVGHGTHVAGIIAARGLQIPEGVAPNCSLVAVRTLATMRDGDALVGAGIVDNINVAIKWAVDAGVDVINASLGIRHAGGGLPHEEVIAYALARGVTVVAASGNDGTPEKYYPGALPGVIAVGAGDPTGAVAGFSSYGAEVSLIAPGTTIASTEIGGGYKLASGTSQASPFVAGAVALLRAQALARGERLSDRDVKEILMRTCDQPRGPLRDRRRGYGHLNLGDACQLLNNTLRQRNTRLAA
ncbi:S8 family peptidase [Thetidibacter halocola]|uniref:S8 family serine peptidase n=1 Tax=Thetidibacter halocola TaxID=2827239 RepID=A0A8J7WCG0_9RHOB|nr:S8 family serine peptidase [Thetidibacter halocola]MBS0125002.1 S8 family serine peptidase [Thetidibacter halocola]